MSGFCGIVCRRDDQVSKDHLHRMNTGMLFWGPDGISSWNGGQVGLSHFKLVVTPESRYESLPKVSSCGRYIITSQGRIDNRSELLKRLEISEDRWKTIPDSDVMLASYRVWGKDCCRRLMGDWSFAVWDTVDRGLFLARDQFGHTSVYYTLNGKTFSFASSIRAILSSPDVDTTLDEELLGCMFYRVDPFGSVRTIYSKICRLSPGHWMWLDGSSLRSVTCQYWDPNTIKPVVYACDDDYIEHFKEIFTEAVRCRLRSIKPIGIFLSAGLDSSAVAAEASNQLKNNAGELTAFHYTPGNYPTSSDVRVSDESEWVEFMVSDLDNVRVDWVRDTSLSLQDVINTNVDVLDANALQLNMGNMWWIMEGMRRAAENNIGVMLSGSAGNGTISYSGQERLYQLFFLGRWKTFFREIGNWCDHYDLSVAKVGLRLLLGPLVASLQKRFLSALKFNRRIRIINQEIPIDRMFEKRIKRSLQKRNFRSPAYLRSCFKSRHNRLLLIDPKSDRSTVKVGDLYAWMGLEQRDPTRDLRVVEFCLGVPIHQFFQDGWDRALVRRAMRDKLPEEILYRKTRGLQAIDSSSRIHKDYLQLRDMIERISISDFAAKYIDMVALRRCLLYFKENGGCFSARDYIRAGSFLRSVAIGCFLQKSCYDR